MTQINDNARFTEHGHAARQLREQLRETKRNLMQSIDSAMAALDEARLRLMNGDMPNTCGILQTRATEVEMGIGRLAALRDAGQHIETLIKATEAQA